MLYFHADSHGFLQPIILQPFKICQVGGIGSRVGYIATRYSTATIKRLCSAVCVCVCACACVCGIRTAAQRINLDFCERDMVIFPE